MTENWAQRQAEEQDWLSQEEWERLVKVWRTRANEEFERAEAAERRADALKRALRRLVDDIKRGWMGDAMSEAQAVLADQPAQDGGRGATPENVNDYLDGHDNGLNVGYRQGWNDALVCRRKSLDADGDTP
jgi:hypothetical protein